MDLNAILSSDEDVKNVRLALIKVKNTMREAAQDYAEAALGASQEVFDSVKSAQPCAGVWPHMAEYQKFAHKTQEALQATIMVTGLLLEAEETGNDYTDKVNQTAKTDSLETHVIAALLEGAATRMTMAMRGIPNTGSPGALCNPKALEQKPPPPPE